MAQLMMCPACQSDIPPGSQYCGNFCFVTPVPRAPSGDGDEPPAPDPDPGPTPESSPACDDPDCAHGGRPPSAGCRHCGLLPATSPAPALSFDWGPVAVPAGRSLVVGREDSPLADRIRGQADWSNVSRRHAEIRSDGAVLTVTDLDSMNGTFLNGERLPAGRTTPLKAGDRVRFAARLEATVTGNPSSGDAK